jgi:hypothetical protein
MAQHVLVALSTMWMACLGCEPGKSRTELDETDRRSIGAELRQAAWESPASFEGLDQGLVREITTWKKGDRPPKRLLKFPNGPPDHLLCGMRSWGDAVDDYVSAIDNVELLQALLFEPRADSACVQAAARRLLQVQGVRAVRAMLSEERRKDPRRFLTKDLATLTQLLAGPYAWIEACSLDKKDAESELAEKVLGFLKADLNAGIPWAKAYRKAAELVPYKLKGRPETHLCHVYGGLISPTGFDILDRYMTDQLDASVVRKLFDVKVGVHRLDTADRYWLFQVKAIEE